MRYALRNQKKIIASLGGDYCNLLLKSIAAYGGKKDTEPEQEIEGEPYRTIEIESVKKDTKFVFYVISKKYDVYTLAYKQQITICK